MTREDDTVHPHPRDPRQRRAGGPFAPPIDTAAAAIRLEVAAASMRADQLERGPAAADVAAAVQFGTTPEPLTAQAFAAALADDVPDGFALDVAALGGYEDDTPATVAESPEPAAVAPLPPVDGAPSQAPTVDEVTIVTPALAAAVFSSEHGGRALTWASRHDPRSLAYGVRAVLPGSAPLADHMWPTGPVLDQGTEGQCVGCAVVDAANVAGFRPFLAPPLDLEDAAAIYKRAQQLDEVPGEDYSGTSVLAGMQAAVEAGLFGGYRWAFGTRDIAQAVLQVGPVVVGIPWPGEWFDVGADGLLSLQGAEFGDGLGHCLAVVGIRLKGPQQQPGPYFVLQNSYGAGWGDGGLGYVHHRDLAALLHGTGEAAIPTRDRQAPGV